MSSDPLVSFSVSKIPFPLNIGRNQKMQIYNCKNYLQLNKRQIILVLLTTKRMKVEAYSK